MTIYTSKINRTAVLAVLFVAFNVLGLQALPSDAYASQSKLSSGRWVKIKVENTGIYAITQSNLSQWGFSDMSKVKIYGYGGAPISEVLNAGQIDDLPQVPVLALNGKLLFYAQGPTTWKTTAWRTDVGSFGYVQCQHPYATAGYYLVTDADTGEERSVVPAVPAEAQGSAAVQSVFVDRQFYEKELSSPSSTGRYLLGDDFKYNTSQNFKFSLTGCAEGTDNVRVVTSFAAKTTGGVSRLTFQYNGNNVPTASGDVINANTSSYTAVNILTTAKTLSLTTPDLTWGIGYSYSGTLYTANLDYITVNYLRNISLVNGSLLFRTQSTNAVAVKNCTDNTHVWDVTSLTDVFECRGTFSNSVMAFSPRSGNREYMAFDEGASFPSPSLVKTVANQNIHGEATPDMVIITPAEFNAQAQRIANMHETVDSMRVLVVNEETVFNEFSSGTPDIMAYRKMVKMFYDRGSDGDGHKLGYLLLFGRGTYDNRQVTSTVKSLGYPMLLTWQSEVGNDELSSYSTDDILGFLADGSGQNMSGTAMDISVGRMPVKTVSEAKGVVDKLYTYVTKADYGSWKNNVLMVADDQNSGVHMAQADSVIYYNKANGGANFVYNRIYLDSYQEESSGSGRSYPGARKDLFRKLDEGVLVLGYIGHSNGVGWTHEGLLNNNDINNMYLKHYPLFYTASCEFTRLDAPTQSGGETLFLNERGGAIALISTARQVTIAENGTLNKYVARYMYNKDSQGNYLRIGDILRLGKNRYMPNGNRLRYFLVGDPAMRLAYPTYNVKVENINGETVNEDNMPVFQARESMVVKGSVYKPNGEKATDFNGTIIPTLYDAEQSVETHGYGSDGVKFVYQDRSNKLAVSKDSVVNGEFSVKLIVPSEITFPSSFDNYSPAMLSFYANSDNGQEANGVDENLYVYGYNEDVAADTVGPDIKTFVLNSETFKSGDEVNDSPMVIAQISDMSGINFSSSGIGHQMTLLLDEKESYSDVSMGYTPDLTSEGMGGTINYSLSDLTEGTHTLRLKVWDSYNNSSEKNITFKVVAGLKPQLIDVYTTSNPASVEAQFYVKHNRPDAQVAVTLSIYDLMGREIWSTQETGKSDMFTTFPITWNLTDAAGRRVQRGIYLYKVGISTDGETESTAAKKIAVTAE